MLGLVLEGGGAKGSFHAGVLKALFERGYRFDGVMGTSIGAINGAMVAQGDFERCYEMWSTITPSMVFDIDDGMVSQYLNKKWDKDTVLYFFRFIRSAISNKGISIEKAKNLLSQYIDEDKLRNSPVDFGIVTVSITDDWTPIEIFKDEMEEGSIVDYIMASANFPLFENKILGGKRYMDGGIYDNLPINPLVRRGYNDIIAVRTMSNMPHKKVIDKSVRINYITPSEVLGNTLSFTTEKLKYNLQLGYFDGLRFTDKLFGKKYYLEGMDDGEFVAFMERYGAELYRAWAAELGIEGDKKEIIYAVSDYINKTLKAEFTLYGAFIALLEPFAAAYGLERFTIYKFGEFLKSIREAYLKNGRIPPEQKMDARLMNMFYTYMEINLKEDFGDL